MSTYTYGSAQLDRPAADLIAQARGEAVPEAARLAVTSAPEVVVMRACDQLRVADVDFRDKFSLAEEIVTLTRPS